jgi:hypothetical protein
MLKRTIRKTEDLLKNIFYLHIILINHLFFFFYNKKKTKLFFKDFFNHDAYIYFVLSLSQKNIFLYKINDSITIAKKFGFKNFLKNFLPNYYFKDFIGISFKNKKEDIYINLDYFIFFDKNKKETKNSIVCPYYLTKKFYLSNSNYNNNFNEINKIYPIMFIGSTHPHLYTKMNFYSYSDNRFLLNRMEIIKIILKNFSEETLIVKNKGDLQKLKKNKKKIILILSDHTKFYKNKKIMNFYNHIKTISQSKFFLCMPGTSMPLCYHLTESMFVGTIPILSYRKYLYPELNNTNSLSFYDERTLIRSINDALYMKEHDYNYMRKNILLYYKKYILMESFLKRFSNKKFPLEVFLNVDHYTYDQKISRDVKNNKITFNSKNSNV